MRPFRNAVGYPDDVAFPRKHLYNTEEIVLDRSPHWWFLTPHAAALVLATVLGIWALAYDFQPGSNWEVPLRVLAGAFLVVALVAFLARLIVWRTTLFVVTTERCIYRAGVFKKTGIEIPLDRINTVLFSQTLFERMLGAGDISIESAGESSRQNFSDIRSPIMVQNLIYQQMEENENRKYDRIGAEAREAAQAAGAAHAANPAPAPAPADPPTQVMSVAEQLHKLAELHERGILTDEQFERQKAQLLGD